MFRILVDEGFESHLGTAKIIVDQAGASGRKQFFRTDRWRCPGVIAAKHTGRVRARLGKGIIGVAVREIRVFKLGNGLTALCPTSFQTVGHPARRGVINRRRARSLDFGLQGFHRLAKLAVFKPHLFIGAGQLLDLIVERIETLQQGFQHGITGEKLVFQLSDADFGCVDTLRKLAAGLGLGRRGRNKRGNDDRHAKNSDH